MCNSEYQWCRAESRERFDQWQDCQWYPRAGNSSYQPTVVWTTAAVATNGRVLSLPKIKFLLKPSLAVLSF